MKMIANNWAGMVALTGAFVAGTFVMGTLSGFISLPEQHKADIRMLDARLTPVETYIQEQRVLICLQTQQALDRPVEVCLTRP